MKRSKLVLNFGVGDVAAGNLRARNRAEDDIGLAGGETRDRSGPIVKYECRTMLSQAFHALHCPTTKFLGISLFPFSFHFATPFLQSVPAERDLRPGKLHRGGVDEVNWVPQARR